jgi:hypothetical protein
MIAARKQEFAPAPTVDGRKVMPIEQALVWAYQTELCALSEGAFADPVGGWSSERVDGSRGGWDDAAVARIVNPDALEMHKWVQHLEQPGWLAVDEDLGLMASTYESLSEPAYFAEALPKAATLVIVNARLGKVPELSEGPTPYAIRHPTNGTVPIKRVVMRAQKTIDQREVSYADSEEVRQVRAKGRGGVYPQGSFCEVGYFPDWDAIVQERAEYLVWWLALRWLADNLDHLARVRVLPPDLPMRPWQEAVA